MPPAARPFRLLAQTPKASRESNWVPLPGVAGPGGSRWKNETDRTAFVSTIAQCRPQAFRLAGRDEFRLAVRELPRLEAAVDPPPPPLLPLSDLPSPWSSARMFSLPALHATKRPSKCACRYMTGT